MLRSFLQNYKLHLLVIFPVIMGILVIEGVSAAMIPEHQRHQGELVTRKQTIIADLALLLAHVTDAETGQRGYLLTGQEDYLAPYNESLDKIKADQNNLRTFLADDPEQEMQLTILNSAITTKLQELRETIEYKKELNNDQALKTVMSGRGREQMETIRNLIDAMQEKQQQDLTSQVGIWQQTADNAREKFLVGGGLLCLMVTAICVLLYVEIERRKRFGFGQQAETQRLAKVIAIQREISAHHFDLEETMRIITKRTQDLSAATGSIVEIFEGGEMVYKAASGTGEPHVGLRIKAKGSLSGLCITENKIMKCDDSETDYRVDRDACRKVGLRSMVVLPLRHEGRAVGVLKVMSPEIAAFREKDVSTLELLAVVLSAALSDAMASQTIQNINQQLTKANAALVMQNDQLSYMNEKMEALATTDALTGLKNRRVFFELLVAEFRRFERYKTPLSMALIDVDHFKSFNDSFGHPAGDLVLKKVAEVIKAQTRDTDCVARYGGEEFVVLMPETDLKGAMLTANRICEAVANTTWGQRKMTVSIGVSTLTGSIKNADAMIEIADKALYQSKNGGRNRVTA